MHIYLSPHCLELIITMDKDYKSLAGFRSHVTRAINYLAQAIQQNAETDYIREQVEFLREKWKKYNERWEEFGDNYSNCEDFDKYEDSHTKIEDEYQNAQLNASTELKKLTPNPSQASSTQGTLVNFMTKLPDIKLAEFHGNYTEWEQFWNQFSSLVDTKTDLSEVTKYTYLTQCIKGSAKEVIAGYRGEAADYQDAIHALKSFYGDKKRIKRLLTRKLINLEKTKCSKPDLVTFMLSLETILKQLGHDPDITISECEWLIAEIITMKLPKEAEEFIFNLNKTMYFSLDQIRDGLQTLIDYLESKDERRLPNDRQVKVNSKPNSVHHNDVVSGSSQNASSAIGTYAATTNFITCIYWGINHKTYQCTEYCTVSARKERLRTLRRCTWCTKPHNTEACDVVLTTCRLCNKGKHHVFLCINSGDRSNQNKSVGNSAMVNNTFRNHSSSGNTVQNSVKFGKGSKVTNSPKAQSDSNRNSQVVSSALSAIQNTNYSVALATATVFVQSGKGQGAQARAFFDSGSQRSFIRRDLSNQLKLIYSNKVDMTLDTFDNSGSQKTYEVVRPTVSLGGKRKRLTLLVVDKLPRQISTPGLLDTAHKLSQAGFQLADQNLCSDTVKDIQVLIGSDFMGRFVFGMKTVNDIDLLESAGGHLIYGRIPRYIDNNPISCSNALIAEVLVEPTISPNVTEPRNICSRVIDEVPPVHKLWELDVMGINPTQESINDIKSLKHYKATVKHDGERYWVELPFKTNHPTLPNNYKLALGQMYSQRKKFLHTPKLLKCYCTMI